MGSGFVALVAIIRLHQLWTFGWLIADVALLAARLLVIAAYQRRDQTSVQDPSVWAARYVPFGVCACLLLGSGAMLSLIVGDDPLATLSIMVTAGVLGGIASRNAVVPRFALLQIALGIIPIGIGAVFAAGGHYWILVPPLFIYAYTMSTLVKAGYSSLVALMVAEETNAELAARFDAALAYMPLGLCTVNDRGQVVVANKKIAELFGTTIQSLKLNVSLPEFIGNVSLAAFGEAFSRQLVARCTAWLEVGDRSLEFSLNNGVHLHMTRSHVPDGSAVIIIEDVSERHLIESKLHHLAQHDALTGLPNRRYFNDYMVKALQRPTRISGDQRLAVMCLDLDGFKPINDRFGHSAGDEVLQMATNRFKDGLPDTALLTRLGGDEFAVVVPESDVLRVTLLASQLVANMAEPFVLRDGESVWSGLSVGVAFARSGESFDALMGRADVALYAAKNAGKSTFRFADDMIRG
jgi:diguanylate cyclase (GGDEF)-like protein